jgi:hypothetical protein
MRASSRSMITWGARAFALACLVFNGSACVGSNADRGSEPDASASPDARSEITACAPGISPDAGSGCVQNAPIGCYPGAPCLFTGTSCSQPIGPCGEMATFTCQDDLTYGNEVDDCSEGATCNIDPDGGCGPITCTCTGAALLCDSPKC